MAGTHTFTSIAHLLLLFSFSPLGLPYSQAAKEPASATNTQTFRCSEMERKALLSFKQSLLDPSGRLSSWVGEDCCKWIGVGCEYSRTGHVVRLDLRNPHPIREFFDEDIDESFEKFSLGGKISPYLLDLKNLSYLDLSLNNFTGNKIPEFLGSLESLSYLNLSFSFFAGVIPPHLGNLSRLQYLDLESSRHSQGLDVKNLKWLVGFRSLKYLNLGYANLTKVPDWLEAVNTLSSLLELHLSGCGLVSLPHSLSPINFTMLSVLDLSFNNFNSSIPHWLSNVSELSILNLAVNSLRGAIPEAFADLDSLQELDLSQNSFIEGPLPVGLGHLTHLRKLDLFGNNNHGKIPSSFCNLCNLRTFILSFNSISGEINEFVDGLSRCSNSVLESLDLSGNRLLGGNLPYSIGALQKLQSLDLFSCSFRGSLPESIGNLSSLQRLSLWRNQMSGTIPKSIGKLSMLVAMNLGENFWEGVLTGAHFQNLTRLKYISLSRSKYSTLVLDVKHDWVPPFKLNALCLHHMPIGPSFPAWLQTQNRLFYLCLEDVGISDPIPENIGKLWPNLEYLNLGSNSIIGEISSSIGLLKNLSYIRLRNNCLSGEFFPPLWEDLKRLSFLDLTNNNISGNLPSSMGYLTSMMYLSLGKNHLEGQLPSWFRNFSNMLTLDLGENNFSGNLPTWIGKSLSSLFRLNLRSNWFVGDLPQDLCLLSQLKILDLAQNNLSGRIPHCLGNLSKNDNYHTFSSWEQMEMVWKRREDLYGHSNIDLVYSLDLSDNNLSGEIPEGITALSLLVNLNLSMNHLIGKIPKGIGNLHHLESLDLSRNTLSGSLPQELSSLNFLSHLNLSFNNFSGKIPSGNQLQTLNDPSMYEGNALLCGPPLSTKCPWEGDDPQAMPIDRLGRRKKIGEEVEAISFYISMVVGFIVGFLGVCGTLVVKRSWRQAYYQGFDDVKERMVYFMTEKAIRCLGKIKFDRK